MAKVKSKLVYGDGTIIDKRPMINVMTASAYNPQALCHDVIDCSNHMADWASMMLNTFLLSTSQQCKNSIPMVIGTIWVLMVHQMGKKEEMSLLQNSQIHCCSCSRTCSLPVFGQDLSRGLPPNVEEIPK